MKQILEAIFDAGGHPYYVGGCVRDLVMGIEPKDYDVEVYGLSIGKLSDVLSKFGQVNEVGKQFGILKLKQGNIEYDFSVPRRENRVGVKHTDFRVELDENITPREAAARRDFTMNAMFQEPLSGEIVDLFGGRDDITVHMLNPTSEAFKEDALRVLRGMQFAGRFDMWASNKLIQYAKVMINDYHSLAKERIWEEWKKWAEKSIRPSCGLSLLEECQWIWLYPELAALMGCVQDKEWHPEGDVFSHTCHVVDEMAATCRRENIVGENRLVLMFAALCHDLGKPSTTEFIRGRWRAPGHDKAGVEPTKHFLASIGCPVDIIKRVVPLVAEHMAHIVPNITPRFVRRLSVRLEPATINELDLLVEADMGGRPPLPKGKHGNFAHIMEVAKLEAIDNAKPKPILTGKHLIEIGMEPSPEFGRILKRAYEAQLDGNFTTAQEGLRYLRYWLVI